MRPLRTGAALLLAAQLACPLSAREQEPQPEPQREQEPQPQSAPRVVSAKDPTDGETGGRGLARRRGGFALLPADQGNAVRAGLAWLVVNQHETGRWSSTVSVAKADRGIHDVGTTALAVLALLGEGGMKGHPHPKALHKGIDWLLTQQQPNGLIGVDASHSYIYGHAVSTLALAEAAAMGVHPGARDALQAAINHMEAHRNPYMVWRYQPQGGGNDTSVTSWCVLAYLTAQKVDGIEINDNALKAAALWLDQVTDPVTGRVGYTQRGELSSRALGKEKPFPRAESEGLTAGGAYLRLCLGQTIQDTEVLDAHFQLLASNPPAYHGTPKDPDDPLRSDAYYWFYASHAWCARHHPVTAPDGTTHPDGAEYWRRHLAPQLVARQVHKGDPEHRGSWDPIGPWAETGGRVYTTALAVIALQAPYRTL